MGANSSHKFSFQNIFHNGRSVRLARDSGFPEKWTPSGTSPRPSARCKDLVPARAESSCTFFHFCPIQFFKPISRVVFCLQLYQFSPCTCSAIWWFCLFGVKRLREGSSFCMRNREKAERASAVRARACFTRGQHPIAFFILRRHGVQRSECPFITFSLDCCTCSWASLTISFGNFLLTLFFSLGIWFFNRALRAHGYIFLICTTCFQAGVYLSGMGIAK